MWNCYLLQILFSLMFTPEAAAAPRWPWSSVLLPQRSRAPATQFTVLKLENKSKRNRISNSFPGGMEILLASLDSSCHLQAASVTQPRWWLPHGIASPPLFPTLPLTLTPSLFPPKNVAKLDLDGNLNVVSLWKKQNEGAVGLLALIVMYFRLSPFYFIFSWTSGFLA